MTIMRGKYFKIIALLFCVLCMMISSSCLSKKEAKNGIPNTQPTSLPTTEITTIPNGGNDLTVQDIEKAFIQSVTVNSVRIPQDYIERPWIPDYIEKCLCPDGQEILEEARRRGCSPASLLTEIDDAPEISENELTFWGHTFNYKESSLFIGLQEIFEFYAAPYVYYDNGKFYNGGEFHDNFSSVFVSVEPEKTGFISLREDDPNEFSTFLNEKDYLPGSHIENVYESDFTLHIRKTTEDYGEEDEWDDGIVLFTIQTDIGTYLYFIDA